MAEQHILVIGESSPWIIQQITKLLNQGVKVTWWSTTDCAQRDTHRTLIELQSRCFKYIRISGWLAQNSNTRFFREQCKQLSKLVNIIVFHPQKQYDADEQSSFNEWIQMSQLIVKLATEIEGDINLTTVAFCEQQQVELGRQWITQMVDDMSNINSQAMTRIRGNSILINSNLLSTQYTFCHPLPEQLHCALLFFTSPSVVILNRQTVFLSKP